MPFKINQPDKRGSEGPCSTLSQKNLNIGNRPVSVTVRADSMLSDFYLLTENRHLSLFSVLLLQTGPAFFMRIITLFLGQCVSQKEAAPATLI